MYLRSVTQKGLATWAAPLAGLVILSIVVLSTRQAAMASSPTSGLHEFQVQGVVLPSGSFAVKGDVIGHGTASASLPGGSFYATTANGEICDAFSSVPPVPL